MDGFAFAGFKALGYPPLVSALAGIAINGAFSYPTYDVSARFNFPHIVHAYVQVWNWTKLNVEENRSELNTVNDILPLLYCRAGYLIHACRSI